MAANKDSISLQLWLQTKTPFPHSHGCKQRLHFLTVMAANKDSISLQSWLQQRLHFLTVMAVNKDSISLQSWLQTKAPFPYSYGCKQRLHFLTVMAANKDSISFPYSHGCKQRLEPFLFQKADGEWLQDWVLPTFTYYKEGNIMSIYDCRVVGSTNEYV